MGKRNKKRRRDDFLTPVITVLKDGFLGGLLLIAISHGVHVFNKAEENNATARHAVLSQFVESKNILIDQINVCLNGKNITKQQYMLRVHARESLVATAVKNKLSLPTNAYFNFIQYTRFDDADATQNLCKLSADQLKILIGQINELQVKLQSEIRK